MNREHRVDLDQAAFRRVKPHIDQTYPHGHFVAIENSRIVANAATLEELDGILNCLGKRSKEIMVVQAGVDYPEYVHILLGA